MLAQSRFVIMEHEAIKAGKHNDLRIKKPRSDMWASWAIPKGVPVASGSRTLAISTNDHIEKDALYTGKISPGEYGAGVIKELDSGDCNIYFWTDKHIRIEFKGKKFKGIYHLVRPSNFKKKEWLIFKSK